MAMLSCTLPAVSSSLHFFFSVCWVLAPSHSLLPHLPQYFSVTEESNTTFLPASLFLFLIHRPRHTESTWTSQNSSMLGVLGPEGRKKTQTLISSKFDKAVPQFERIQACANQINSLLPSLRLNLFRKFNSKYPSDFYLDSCFRPGASPKEKVWTLLKFPFCVWHWLWHHLHGAVSYSTNADNPGSRSWLVVERILVGFEHFW